MSRYLRRLARWLNRLLLRVGLLPVSTRAETDTMGEYKRLQAEKDDPRPGLVLPDPNAPHAELIRRVRLYAQNGAKALAPLLDRPLPVIVPDPDDEESYSAWVDAGSPRPLDEAGIRAAIEACEDVRQTWQEREGIADLVGSALLDEFELLGTEALQAIHAAYNSPWTVIDGEVYEYESEKKRRVLQ